MTLSERQRVWRACDACRKKKIKCDGQQPCQSCCRNNIDCAYADPLESMRGIDAMYVARLENKIRSMEQRLLELSDKQPEGGCESVGDVLIPSLVRESQDPQLQQNTQTLPTEDDVQLAHQRDETATGITERQNGRDVEVAPTPQQQLQQRPQSSNDSGSLELANAQLPVNERLEEEDAHYPMNGHNSAPSNPNSLLPMGSLGDSEDTAILDQSPQQRVRNLPDSLARALIDLFYKTIFPMFPIISEYDFRRQYANYDTSSRDQKTGLSFLLPALLAVSAPLLQPSHPIFDELGNQPYQSLDLGSIFYSLAIEERFGNPTSGPVDDDSRRSMNIVIAQGLLSLYLVEKGNANDAWVTVGHAVRLYHALNLEDTTEVRTDYNNLRWCLYTLDCSLSTVLLKPLAMDEVEYDADMSTSAERVSGEVPDTEQWFPVITNVHITLGRVYRAIRPLRSRDKLRSLKSNDALKSSIQKHDSELENYFTEQVLPKIKSTPSWSKAIGLQNIAISSYHVGLVLLYGRFIQSSEIATAEAYLRCAEAASNCINFAPNLIATVPTSHFVIQQYRALYVSMNVLLYCMRFSRHVSFTAHAWPDLERGLEVLRNQKIQWPEIEKYRLLTEEKMERTRVELNQHELVRSVFDDYTARYYAQHSPGTSRHQSESQSDNYGIPDEGTFNQRSTTSEKRTSPNHINSEGPRNSVSRLGCSASENGRNMPVKYRKISHQATGSMEEPVLGIDRHFISSYDNTSTADFLIPELQPSALDLETSQLFDDLLLMPDAGHYMVQIDE
ncbi:hypothetical protein F5884DRAFT_511525 [Xylogone sp. PMI_703]|nr:hypothetical protein F5884DRAFT_511525 [Xylogone sp. PMI_703]